MLLYQNKRPGIMRDRVIDVVLPLVFLDVVLPLVFLSLCSCASLCIIMLMPKHFGFVLFVSLSPISLSIFPISPTQHFKLTLILIYLTDSLHLGFI